MSKRLSLEEKGIIVGIGLAGMSHAEIAVRRNTPKPTVSYIIRIYHPRGTTEHALGAGRPRSLSERDLRGVIRNTKRGQRATLEDITQMVPHEVSKGTVRRALHSAGIFRPGSRKETSS